jgi:hypothetical protein
MNGELAKGYPVTVIEAWARPITDEAIERFLGNRDQEIRLVAELDGQPVGIGDLEVTVLFCSPGGTEVGQS